MGFKGQVIYLRAGETELQYVANKLKMLTEPPNSQRREVLLIPEMDSWILGIFRNFCVHFHHKLPTIPNKCFSI